jgi:hypothetical protein
MQAPSINSLKRAIVIAEQIRTLEAELSSLLNGTSLKVEGGGSGAEVPSPFKVGRKKRKMSKAGRERIAAAQRARWAKVKAKK